MELQGLILAKDEIKKAFNICHNTQSCTGCPMLKIEKQNGHGCKYNLFTSVISLITEQEEEIKSLKIQLEQANAGIVNYSGCELHETNAVKEFAEKLKVLLYTVYGNHGAPLGDLTAEDIACEIDELLKNYKE